MQTILISGGVGMILGGAVVYYFYAKLKSSIVAVQTVAADAKKDL